MKQPTASVYASSGPIINIDINNNHGHWHRREDDNSFSAHVLGACRPNAISPGWLGLRIIGSASELSAHKQAKH